MQEPEAYRWDYERNPWDSAGGATTFSVGVFQWLPKAGGKGLKKSKSIRVLGYTAEPLRVYTKAQELCDRLNAEGAQAEDPPAWLQKQYSVPKPEDHPREPPREELTGSQVRAVRLQVMRRCLEPEGFVKVSGSTWVRRRDDQIHLLDFQAGRWGGDYTVNLGFHYAFVPPFSQRAGNGSAEFGLLDCAVYARIGRFGPEGQDVWFEYGQDRERLAGLLEQNARDGLAVFDRYGRKWQDPEVWLKALRSGEGVPGGDAAYWQLHWPELFGAAIAEHLGQSEAARDFAARLLARVEWGSVPPACQPLLRQLGLG